MQKQLKSAKKAIFGGGGESKADNTGLKEAAAKAAEAIASVDAEIARERESERKRKHKQDQAPVRSCCRSSCCS